MQGDNALTGQLLALPVRRISIGALGARYAETRSLASSLKMFWNFTVICDAVVI